MGLRREEDATAAWGHCFASANNPPLSFCFCAPNSTLWFLPEGPTFCCVFLSPAQRSIQPHMAILPFPVTGPNFMSASTPVSHHRLLVMSCRVTFPQKGDNSLGLAQYLPLADTLVHGSIPGLFQELSRCPSSHLSSLLFPLCVLTSSPSTEGHRRLSACPGFSPALCSIDPVTPMARESLSSVESWSCVLCMLMC